MWERTKPLLSSRYSVRMQASIQLLRPNCTGSNSCGYKYFLGTQVVEQIPLRHVDYLQQLMLGVAQPAVVVFIFFSPAFCKKCISKHFIFQLEQSVNKGLKPKILNGTVSVGRFVMVCTYIHTVLGIKKCEHIKRLNRVNCKRLQILKFLLSKATTALFKK